MARRRRSRRSTKRFMRANQEGSGEPPPIPIEGAPPAEAQPGAGDEIVDVPEPKPKPAPEPEAAPAPKEEAVEAPEPAEKPGDAAAPAAEAAPAREPGKKPGRQSARGGGHGSSSKRPAAARASGRAGARKSGRREAEESRESSRGSGRQRAMPEKTKNFTPIIIGAAVAVVVIAALAYGPMERRSLVKAVASGTKPGYDAAWMMPTLGTGAISPLCAVVDRGSDRGRLAAAGGLARIARMGGANDVLSAVRARLDGSPSPEARAAYAAALSQAGTPGCTKAAAALVTDTEPSVRKSVVQGLAHGKKTAEAAAALGAALGDEDADVRDFAQSTLNDWAKTDSQLMLNAADAAMSLGNQVAHKGAARILSIVATRAGDERLKLLLRDASPAVRRLGADAVAVSGSADPEVQKILADIVGSPAEPPEVRRAALEAARAIRAVPVGGAALEILKGRGDTGLRAKAAGVVAVTRPEGAVDALLGILASDRTPQKLRNGVLDALFAAGRIEGEAQIKVARELVSIAEGDDETAAGLALLALRTVSGLRAVKYGPKQWRNWLERREYERELVKKAPLVMERMKAEYDVHGDPDRVIQHEALNKIGSLLQEARDGADQQDQAPLQEWISKLMKFKEGYR